MPKPARASRFFTVVIEVLLLAAAWIEVARAAPVQPDDMFFGPATMVPGIYPIQAMTGDGTTTPWTVVWTTADIASLDPGRVDISFVGIKVLPVLVANPSSADGAYDSAALSAINVTNYGTHFLQQPGTSVSDLGSDYSADLDPGQLTFQADAPAIYNILVRTQSRPAVAQPFENIDYMYTQFAGDFFVEKGQRDEASPKREMELHASDCYVIASPDTECTTGLFAGNSCTTKADCPDTTRCAAGPNKGALCTLPEHCPQSACIADQGICNTAMGNAAQTLIDEGQCVCRAASPEHAKVCAQQRSQELGRKITVTFIGHGNSGVVKFGDGLVAVSGGEITPGDFAEDLAPWVNGANFFACKIANGPAGTAFLTQFATHIRPVRAWHVTLSAAKGYFNTVAGASEISLETQEIPGQKVPALKWSRLAVLTLMFVAIGVRYLGVASNRAGRSVSR